MPNVRYGKDACDYCRMIINDQRFAAAVTLPSGDVRKFDDVCCLVDYLANNPTETSHTWVRGYETNDWCRADVMFFVYGPKLQTPMASGIAAVKTMEQAEALTRTWGGKTLRFDELADFLKNRQRTPPGDDVGPNPPPTIPSKELQ